MMKRALTVAGVITSLWVSPILAQDDGGKEKAEPGPWSVDVVAGVNLSQASFSNNWSGGDKGSATWVLNSDVSATRQFSESFNLSNLLQLAFGQTLRQVEDPDNPDRNKWDVPEKTTDLIQLESVGRITLNWFIDPYVAFRFDSQFLDESDPIGDIMFNPVKLKETAGVARVLEKTKEIETITRVGFGFRQNFGRAFADSIGDRTESFSSNDGGLEWQTDMTRPLLNKRVLYKGKLLIYLPLFYSKSSALEDFDAMALMTDPEREAVADYWKSADVNFQNTFTAKITELLSVNLYLQLIYDKFAEATNVDPELSPAVLARVISGGVRKSGQFKQTLAIGLSYALF